MFEVHVQIKLATVFPSPEEHASRRALEQALHDRGVGTFAGAGAGGGVMDVWVAVEEPARALAQVHEILGHLGLGTHATVTVRQFPPSPDPPDEGERDDAEVLELERRVLELNAEVDALGDQGEHAGAIAKAESVLEMARRVQRPGRSLAWAMTSLAYALDAGERSDDAVTVLREALETVGPNAGRERAGILDQLGRVYRDLGRDAEAVQVLLEANALFQDHPRAERDPRVVLGLEALAHTFMRTGNYLEADALLRSCVRMIEQREVDERDGDKRDELVDTRIRLLHSLATTRDRRGGDARAELEAVIRLLENARGDTRDRLAVTYEELAEIESTRGGHAAAEEHLRDALALRIELGGSDDLGAAHGYYRLAVILQAAGDRTRAREACQRAAAIHRARLSPDDQTRLDTEALLAALEGDARRP